MLAYVLLEPQLANFNPAAFKIGCLANPLKNSIYTTALISLVAGGRLRSYARIGLSVASLNMLGVHSILPALTNTLFTIHPPLLYVCTALVVAGLSSLGRRRILVYSAFWALSICMGGFWSLQELSWGGWWNWDVIECGVAYQWALAALLVHRAARGASAALASSYALVLSAAVYTLLNKLGIGVSIHSFVTSRSVQGHYGLVSALAVSSALIAYSVRLMVPLTWLIVLLLLYCGTRSFIILKPALVWVAMAVPLLAYRRPAIALSHMLVRWSIFTVLVFNYDNSAFFYCDARLKLTANLTCIRRFWHIDTATPLRQKLIWDTLWLSKPRYAYGIGFESWATRSIALRSAFSSFLK